MQLSTEKRLIDGAIRVAMRFIRDILPFTMFVLPLSQPSLKLLQTIVGSKRLLKNANWARYNLAVSRRKDTEPSSSSMWNMNLPGHPVVDFHKLFDGENITQEDLVAWINVGTHHLVG